ncbi:Pyrrolopyrazine biosynthesis cluster protein F [Fulvia fulva]|uniref:Pyrrolopyrazine biosynthesis cluster protein F n=1 Tax=Passalora fulva TaxID=5499 RepID=A0A9Q8L555_PASFU|nr:Pyrrolopyrazine biosynthesis cluster protein F [Fulvia fulva]KAK4635689.1 Pyrrolopyrazine biosynthesis cluster protein F [Fulvia fulva]KAK4636816.1 Pyrrolopyrazine biosynthesis cluster protein F [Fulvia fulva]UJO10998.1 Pyrrolopyrazine biosynthesis cluster protein F [Fulvia fulva]WPV08771.1 Pyrrolopyrazine biosynthesis cluster protein F [Fulvia fulva]WPV24103.1 Pyrrolopyrazine biosynthesis cluster protein F [Fulvia fulva]
MGQWQQNRAFLFSHPRTASNLLTRMLSAQPDWQVSDYLFFDAFQYTRDAFWGVDLDDAPVSARQEHDKLMDQGHERLGEVLCSSLADRKHLLLKDHAHLVQPVETTYDDTETAPTAQLNSTIGSYAQTWRTNPTVFSDSLMLSWTPIILIRNPILIFESWLRAEGDPYPDLESQYANIYTTLRFQRYIFDWYASHPDTPLEPIVLDADDVIERQHVVEKLCDAIGMDKEKLLYTWESTPMPAKFQANERFKRFLQSIQNSTGVDRSKVSGNVTLDDREEQWRETFGWDRALTLARRVRESWPDYEYLHSMRLR